MNSAAWAEEIGAELTETGVPTPASIAAHIRAATMSEGHLTSHRIVRGLKEAYAPFCAEDAEVHSAIHAVLDLLVDIGDLTRFSASAGAAYVATPERLVNLDDDEVAVLGASTLVTPLTTEVVRKLPKSVTQASTAPVLSLADEIGLPAWRFHLLGQGGTDAPNGGPAALFVHLAGLATSGERLEKVGPADLKVLAGTGDFFGNARAPNLEGRWQPWTGGEPVCGVRKRAFNWQNCVVAETPQGPRILDVADPDCWRWSVIGQLRSQGDQVGKRHGEAYQCLTPPPLQIRRLLTLAGEPAGPWRWTVEGNAADLCDRLLGQA